MHWGWRILAVFIPYSVAVKGMLSIKVYGYFFFPPLLRVWKRFLSFIFTHYLLQVAYSDTATIIFITEQALAVAHEEYKSY